jgi:hypothetical protein
MDLSFDETDAITKKGFFKIWAVDPVSGQRTLLRAKDNMILNGGADLLAKALAGINHANISHMYIGYKNTASGVFTRPVIDKAYSTPFTAYGSGLYSDFGYLRLPLAYSPSFIAQEGYSANVALFTTIVATTDNSHGAPFRAADYVGDPSQIFEIGLVAALDPTGQGQDIVFSRANFDPLLYNDNFNLTTTWGIQFLA